MTAVNHALTGALIGFSVSNPLIAVPAAFLSHFVLDALPHFGFKNLQERGRGFAALLITDMFACYAIVAMLVIFQPAGWPVAAVAAFFAASPDFMWAPDYVRYIKNREQRGLSNPLMRFHSWIQWYQKPPGALIEVIYGFGAMLLLATVV